MSNVIEGIEKWLVFGKNQEPTTADYLMFTDAVIGNLQKMADFSNNITDEKSRSAIQKNIQMMSNMLYDNMGMYNDYLKKVEKGNRL